MKKWICAAICALMLMPALSTAMASGVRLPENRGVVTDDADVLSGQTASDIAEYATEVKDETDINVHVAIVHFLDGVDAKTYAGRLFEAWRLGDDDMLLLGAAGEDTFATFMGQDVIGKLGEKNAENLMFTSSEFSSLFRAQQYDAAFGRYFVAFNALVNKQCNENIKLRNLFSDYQTSAKVAAAPKPATSTTEFGSKLWTEVMDAIESSSVDYQTYHENRTHQDNGIGVGGWIVLIIIIMIIFGQSDPVRKARRQGGRNYRRYGCGCSPLGWLVSLFGINVLIDGFFRKR